LFFNAPAGGRMAGGNRLEVPGHVAIYIGNGKVVNLNSGPDNPDGTVAILRVDEVKHYMLWQAGAPQGSVVNVTSAPIPWLEDSTWMLPKVTMPRLAR